MFYFIIRFVVAVVFVDFLLLSYFVSFICRLNIVTGMQKPHNECINTEFSAKIWFRFCCCFVLFCFVGRLVLLFDDWQLHLKLIWLLASIYSLTWNYLNFAVSCECVFDFVVVVVFSSVNSKRKMLHFDAFLHIASAWHTPMGQAEPSRATTMRDQRARPPFDD